MAPTFPKMGKNSKVVHHVGLIEVVPSNSYSRPMKVSNEVQNQVRSSFKDKYGGSSSNVTQSYKAQEFVADKRTGQLGFKQEAKVTYNNKHVDKQQGVTTEYKAQVKVTKSVYPNKGSSNSNNNRINYY